MAEYRLNIISPTWKVTDKPLLSGKVLKDGSDHDGSDFIFGTMRAITWNENILLPESKVAFSGNNFSVQMNYFQYESSGQLEFRYYLKNTAITAVVNGSTLITATTINLTVSVGTIPDSGWCLIGSESMEFTKASASSITVSRSMFSTLASAYSGGQSILFASNRETIKPYIQFEVIEEIQKG